MKKCLALWFGLMLFGKAGAQEMLVIKDTIQWTMESTHGFYFYVQDYISKLPQNWRSPYNYYNGQFYLRFEIISEVTNEPCQLQFGIWQWRLPSVVGEGEKNYSETMTTLLLMNGPGSVVYHNSSPSTWWKSYEGVDFSRVWDFWRLGINIWAVEPRSVISNSNWGGSDALWATRSKWFPIKVYVIVVAVADGYNFSGWNNYLAAPPSPAPTPSYGIDFINETTDKIVPPTDEYSYNQDMSGALPGPGQKLNVQPGKDVYFRTKANANNSASAIQSLDIPSRPVITGPGKDTINGPFTITTRLGGTNIAFKNNDFVLTNCSVSGSGDGTYNVTPSAKGDVIIKLKANSITGGNFATDNFKIYFKPLVSSTDNLQQGSELLIYPQPAGSYLNIKTGNENLPLNIRITDLSGRDIIFRDISDELIDITILEEGLYILSVTTYDGKKFVKKLLVSH